MTRPLTVMLVAAEASGDLLGAGLAKALRARLGEGVRFVGVGGREMAREGVESPFDIASLSILGLVEAIRAYPRVRRRVRETLALAARERPDVAVLIDSWGFTLRVAQGLKRLDPKFPVVKYVAPQVWATRPGRSRTLARSVDLLLSIHAFDAPHFEAEGLKTIFVGNRALSASADAADARGFRERLSVAPRSPILLVLPGSRPAEVNRLLSPFGEATERLQGEQADLRVVIPLAPTVADQVRAGTADWRARPVFVETEAEKRDAYAAANAALACSGTATLELALAGVPMVVAYRVSPLTAFAGHVLIRTRYVTLFNIAAGEEIARELIQRDCTPAKLVEAVGPLLTDPDRAARQVAAQHLALERMGRGGPDPSEKAADAVLQLLRERSSPLPRSGGGGREATGGGKSRAPLRV